MSLDPHLPIQAPSATRSLFLIGLFAKSHRMCTPPRNSSGILAASEHSELEPSNLCIPLYGRPHPTRHIVDWRPPRPTSSIVVGCSSCIFRIFTVLSHF